VLLAAAVGAAVPALMIFGRIYWQGAGPIVAVLGAGVLVGGKRYVQEAHGAAELRRAFSRYLAADVVDGLVESGRMPEVGGHLQNVTVLFCDIRDFTGISRALSPAELVEMISTFFEVMSQPVLDEGGFLDKFVGDEIMAVFGIPYVHDDDTERAVRSALKMLDVLKGFNEWCSQRGWVAVRVSIGIHCGPAIVGNVGWEERMDYTAMGDTVVLAQRMELLSREFAEDILITEEVARALSEKFQVEKVGSSRPKGWNEVVDVYGLRSEL
jgi:adenylate cyclase